MSASKVYFTDMRCPVGTGLLDKLKKLGAVLAKKKELG